MPVMLLALLVASGRVLEFCGAHPNDNPAVKGLTDSLTGEIARAKALSEQKEQGVGLREWATARRSTLERHIRYYLLRPIALFAEVIFKDDPVRAAQFNVPAHGTRKPGNFLVLARTVLSNVQANLDVFVREGLDPALVTQLAESLVDFEKLPVNSATGKRSAGAAREGLDEVADNIMDLLMKLDAIHRHRFQDQPVLLAEWRAARAIPWPKPRKKAAEAKATDPKPASGARG